MTEELVLRSMPTTSMQGRCVATAMEASSLRLSCRAHHNTPTKSHSQHPSTAYSAVSLMRFHQEPEGATARTQGQPAPTHCHAHKCTPLDTIMLPFPIQPTHAQPVLGSDDRFGGVLQKLRRRGFAPREMLYRGGGEGILPVAVAFDGDREVRAAEWPSVDGIEENYRRWGSLQHNNILPTFDYIVDDGQVVKVIPAVPCDRFVNR